VTPVELNLNGYTPVPPGKIAAVVTSLKMGEKPSLPEPSPRIHLRRVFHPEPSWYRALYRRVGQDWMWFSRMALSEADLEATIRAPGVEVYAIDGSTPEMGLVELDRRAPGIVEIAFFGLAPDAIGHGIGSAAMVETLRLAWSAGVSRVWVHTCTLDHPKALSFYRHHGFVAYEQSIEVVDDPRLTGVLPREAAPQVPIIPG
jgi:GNAT superfamily N-acetyltransferase